MSISGRDRPWRLTMPPVLVLTKQADMSLGIHAPWAAETALLSSIFYMCKSPLLWSTCGSGDITTGSISQKENWCGYGH